MTRHLTPSEIVDLLEGGGIGGRRDHLADCKRCRAALEDARAALDAVADDPVPEPSPLFWTHAASRVRRAIDADSRQHDPSSRARLIWAGGMAVAALVAWVAVRPAPERIPEPVAPPAVTLAGPADSSPLDEESWDVIAALGSDLDVDTAQAGIVAADDASDRALLALDDDERAELGALLSRALRRPEI